MGLKYHLRYSRIHVRCHADVHAHERDSCLRIVVRVCGPGGNVLKSDLASQLCPRVHRGHGCGCVRSYLHRRGQNDHDDADENDHFGVRVDLNCHILIYVAHPEIARARSHVGASNLARNRVQACSDLHLLRHECALARCQLDANVRVRVRVRVRVHAHGIAGANDRVRGHAHDRVAANDRVRVHAHVHVGAYDCVRGHARVRGHVHAHAHYGGSRLVDDDGCDHVDDNGTTKAPHPTRLHTDLLASAARLRPDKTR
jgi:hypothetical protein